MRACEYSVHYSYSSQPRSKPAKKAKKSEPDAFTPDFRKALRDKSRRPASPAPVDDRAPGANFELEFDDPGNRTLTRVVHHWRNGTIAREGAAPDVTDPTTIWTRRTLAVRLINSTTILEWSR